MQKYNFKAFDVQKYNFKTFDVNDWDFNFKIKFQTG